MNNSTLRLETPLGTLVFTASSSNDVGNSIIALSHCRPTLSLPNGMSVEQLDAIVLRCTSEVRITDLVYACEWEFPFSKGSSETGEGLDAQSWENGNRLIMIGTEDQEFLHQRLPSCGFSQDQGAPFPDYGLQIKVPVIEQGQRISLHFVVACNSLPEPNDSCWFAVGMNHEKILQCLD